MRTLTAIIAIAFLVLSSGLKAHAQTGGYREVLRFEPDAESGMFYSVSFSPDGKLLAVSTSWPHSIQIRDAMTGQILKTLIEKSQAFSAPKSIPSWSPNGRYIAEVSGEEGSALFDDYGVVYIWEVSTGSHMTIPNRNDRTAHFRDDLGNIGSHHLAWHPNGNTLLLMDNDLNLRLVDFPSGKTRWLIDPYVNQPVDFTNVDPSVPCRPQWNPKGSRFVCLGAGIQAVFDGATGQHLLDLEDEYGQDAYSEWTRDGKYILTVDVGDGGNTYEIKVWDAETGRKANLPKRAGLPFSVSPDGTKIAYIDNPTNEVFIAALKSDEILARISIDHDADEFELSWSPDGNCLAALDRNVTAHIYCKNDKPF